MLGYSVYLMVSVKDQIVLITGASSGIGEACARVFAQAGAKLILAARRQERLEQLADQLSKTYACELHLLPLDVSDRTQFQATLESLPLPWTEVDILINNAGLSRGLDKVHEASIQDWEEMIDTNIKGLLYMTRSLVPGMVSRGRGHVINIGSIAVIKPIPVAVFTVRPKRLLNPFPRG
jgi:serine 3-dehydrogenase